MPDVDFKITGTGEISLAFLQRGCSSFAQASAFVQDLPYKRNADKDDPLCVPRDGCGTCGTKHALLKRLADENGFTSISLVTGIFAMSGANTPAVAATLARHGLEYLPEAHNYLKHGGKVLDFTKAEPFDFIPYLMEEKDTDAADISEAKIKYHKNYLTGWLARNTGVPHSLIELWEIRERCISDIADNERKLPG